MAGCDGNEARVYVTDNTGVGATTEQFARTLGCAVGRMRSRALLDSLKGLEEGGEASAVANAPVSSLS